MPRKEVLRTRKKQAFPIELPIEMYEELRAISFTEHIPIVEIIRKAITNHLSNLKKRKKNN